MPKTIITTVGTSLITNYSEKLRKENQQDNDYQDAYDNLKELPFFEHNLDERKVTKVLERVTTIKTKLGNFSNCAEISSIVAIEKELKITDKKDLTIHLLCTDTILSALCAEVIAKYLQDKGFTVKFEKVEENETIISKIKDSDFSSKYIIKDLRVDSKGNYEKGFMNLIEELDNLKLTKNDILNITGGYKAIIPILTLYGQLREIPLKYLYNDSELDKQNDLVTVGNLPFGLDWAVVEALKPFLKTKFLSQNSILILAKLWFNDKIKFENKNELKNIKRTVMSVFYALISYKLIFLYDDAQVKLTALGLIVKNTSIELDKNKGYIMEHLLFKYFATYAKKVELTKHYSTNFNIATPPKKYILSGEEIQVGDLDVFLSYSNKPNCYDVWAESKAITAAEIYYKKIGTDNDYYKQLKARVLSLNLPYIETLFIVFRFVFTGVNDQEPFISQDLNKVLCHLQKLNEDEALKGKSKFRCFGISIPTNFSGNKIDLTENFYKGGFSTWTWKELYVDTSNDESPEILS